MGSKAALGVCVHSVCRERRLPLLGLGLLYEQLLMTLRANL
jgi:hypothetical protein